MTRETAGRLWPPSPPPPAAGGWTWELRHVRELPGVRAEVREHLATDGPGTSEDRIEQIVLAFDEMASNALRHGAAAGSGAPPGAVTARLAPCAGSWLVEVRDPAPTDPPTPAVGRDPSKGGLGLYLIAELATRHGWHGTEAWKTVWALLPR